MSLSSTCHKSGRLNQFHGHQNQQQFATLLVTLFCRFGGKQMTWCDSLQPSWPLFCKWGKGRCHFGSQWTEFEHPAFVPHSSQRRKNEDFCPNMWCLSMDRFNKHKMPSRKWRNRLKLEQGHVMVIEAGMSTTQRRFIQFLVPLLITQVFQQIKNIDPQAGTSLDLDWTPPCKLGTSL